MLRRVHYLGLWLRGLGLNLRGWEVADRLGVRCARDCEIDPAKGWTERTPFMVVYALSTSYKTFREEFGIVSESPLSPSFVCFDYSV